MRLCYFVLVFPLFRHFAALYAQESEDLKGTLDRTLSILFDWGAESGIWRAPSCILEDFLPYDTLFPMALPIPDHDHSLHHATCLNLLVYYCNI